MKYILNIIILFSGLWVSVYAQSPQPPVKKKVMLEYSKNNIKTREMEFYWAGWNFVEKRDVYRLKTPRDTLFFYLGNEKNGTERYEVIPRGGTPGSGPDNYLLAQVKSRLSNSLSTMSESDENLNYYKCLVKVMGQYSLIWCDPDIYPLKKNVDEYYIDKQWVNLSKTKGDAIRALANMLEIPGGASPNYEEKYLIYDYLKKMNEVKFEKDGKKSYSFIIHSSVKEGESIAYYQITGKVSADGTISENSRKSIVPVTCVSK
ncbi:MAG: hypothetical protein K1X92_13680 [Bacteroidia bacterium]|nr:hypothetical protein [Bacteroidia bacterium]